MSSLRGEKHPQKMHFFEDIQAEGDGGGGDGAPRRILPACPDPDLHRTQGLNIPFRETPHSDIYIYIYIYTHMYIYVCIYICVYSERESKREVLFTKKIVIRFPGYMYIYIHIVLS